MRFSLQNAEFAVGVGLSEAVGRNVRPAAKASYPQSPDGPFSEDQIGEIVASALLSIPAEAGGVDDLVLRSVTLLYADAEVTLEPRDAFKHPLIGPWAAPTFCQAIGNAIRAGSQFYQLAPTSPLFGDMDVSVSRGSATSAIAHLHFPSIATEVFLNFGLPSGWDGAHLASHRIGGSALLMIGAALLKDGPVVKPADSVRSPTTGGRS